MPKAKCKYKKKKLIVSLNTAQMSKKEVNSKIKQFQLSNIWQKKKKLGDWGPTECSKLNRWRARLTFVKFKAFPTCASSSRSLKKKYDSFRALIICRQIAT